MITKSQSLELQSWRYKKLHALFNTPVSCLVVVVVDPLLNQSLSTKPSTTTPTTPTKASLHNSDDVITEQGEKKGKHTWCINKFISVQV